MARYSLKRGATLSLAGTAALPDGVWTATSQLRKNGTKIADLDVTVGAVVNGVAAITLGHAGSTAEWEVGNADCDVRFENDVGDVLYTPTFVINIAARVTEEPSD